MTQLSLILGNINEGDWVALNRSLRRLYDEIRVLTERNIDGDNLSDDLVGDGLSYVTVTDLTPYGVAYRKLTNSLSNTANSAFIRLKGDGLSPVTYYGVECIVDQDSSYGRFCIVDKDALTTQVISLVPLSSSQSLLNFNVRESRIQTTGNFDLILARNTTVMLTLDDTNLVSGTTFTSDTHLTDDLGTSSVAWKEAYIHTIDTVGSANLVLQRNNETRLSLGNTAITSAVTIQSDTDNVDDLGTSGVAWKEGYINILDTAGAVDLVLQRNNSTRLTLTAGAIQVPAGAAASQQATIGGAILQSFADVGNTDAGEDDLHSFSIPASTLGTNGDTLHFVAVFNLAVNGNAKQIKAKFGGTTLLATGSAAYGGDWLFEGWIVRTGAATQRAFCKLNSGDSLLLALADYTTPAETLSSAVTFKFTGEAVATNDIVQKTTNIYWEPAVPA